MVVLLFVFIVLFKFIWESKAVGFKVGNSTILFVGIGLGCCFELVMEVVVFGITGGLRCGGAIIIPELCSVDDIVDDPGKLLLFIVVIIELRRDDGWGIFHRPATLLLDCDDTDFIDGLSFSILL